MGCLLGRQVPLFKKSNNESGLSDGEKWCSSPSEGETIPSSSVLRYANNHSRKLSNDKDFGRDSGGGERCSTDEHSGTRQRSATKETLSARTGFDDEGNKVVNEYVIIKTLGQGSYGKVKLCINVAENEFFAVKICNKGLLSRRRVLGDSTALHDVMREIAILKKLRHKNVVRLYEVINDPSDDRMYMVMEYVQGGPIMDLEKMQGLSDHEAWKYFRDIVSGLEYLHSQKIIHRDIKPENLLVSADGTVKISDFGVSIVFEGDDDTLTRSAGSPAFYAPEMCAVGTHVSGKAVDIYALGVTLYCMIFGRVPFMANSMVEIYDRIRNERLKFPKPVSRELEDLLKRLLEKDPQKRIDLKAIKEHPWVTCSGSLTLRSASSQQEPIHASATEVENAITVNTFVTLVKLKSRMRGLSAMARARLAERCRQAAAESWAGGEVSDSDTTESTTEPTTTSMHVHVHGSDSYSDGSMMCGSEQPASSDCGGDARRERDRRGRERDGGERGLCEKDISPRMFASAPTVKRAIKNSGGDREREREKGFFFAQSNSAPHASLSRHTSTEWSTADECRRTLVNSFDSSSVHHQQHLGRSRSGGKPKSPQTQQFVSMIKEWERKKQQREEILHKNHGKGSSDDAYSRKEASVAIATGGREHYGSSSSCNIKEAEDEEEVHDVVDDELGVVRHGRDDIGEEINNNTVEKTASLRNMAESIVKEMDMAFNEGHNDYGDNKKEELKGVTSLD